MGAGGAIAVGAAIFAGISVQNRGKQDETPQSKTGRGGYQLCLMTDAPMIDGAAKGCYAPEDAALWSDRAVLNDAGEPVRISLSHPSDDERQLAVVENCRRYRELTAEGWYALSSREMRREAYFERACGVLSLLQQAKNPTVTYFQNESMSETDAQSLAGSGGFRIGPVPGGEAQAATIEKTGDHIWTMTASGADASVQELAHADFNNDGRGDILAFVTVAAEEGTAQASRVGILDKASADGPVSFIDRADIR